VVKSGYLYDLSEEVIKMYKYYVIVVEDITNNILLKYKCDELPDKFFKLFICDKLYEINDIILNYSDFDYYGFMVVNIRVSEVNIKSQGKCLNEPTT